MQVDGDREESQMSGQQSEKHHPKDGVTYDAKQPVVQFQTQGSDLTTFDASRLSTRAGAQNRGNRFSLLPLSSIVIAMGKY